MLSSTIYSRLEYFCVSCNMQYRVTHIKSIQEKTSTSKFSIDVSTVFAGQNEIVPNCGEV